MKDPGVDKLLVDKEVLERIRAEGSFMRSSDRSFSYANEVEKVHASLYQKALDNLDNQEETDIYVCSVCGYTCEKEPPEACPICKSKSKAFFKVD